MCLCVVLNEDFLPAGYLGWSMYLMRGEHDDRLMWPFHGYITVQLVNQISDQNHLMTTFEFSGKKLPISSCSRVTSGERAKSGCEEVYMPYKLCIKDDCIKFRVTNIAVVS